MSKYGCIFHQTVIKREMMTQRKHPPIQNLIDRIVEE